MTAEAAACPIVKQSRPAGLFSRAIGLDSATESCFFHFAKYLDQLMQGAKQRQEGKTAPAAKGMDRIGGKARWVKGLVNLATRLTSLES